MSSLEKQVVLVTGCSTGIGRALARELHSRGHRAIATARRPEALADLAREGIATEALDVTDAASVAAAVERVLAREGRIDVVVNNAGINVFGPILEVRPDDLRRVLDTNVVGLLTVTQAVFPGMAKRRSGRIVNVGSVVGLLPTPFAAGYCASKAAVHMLSDVMRMEVAPFGVDVVVVQPGGVKSSIADSASKDLDRYREPTSLYHAVHDGILKRAYASQDNPMPTEDFARRLVDEAFANPAPRIVRLGTGSDYLPRMAEMPPEQRDAMLSGNYGLDRLR